MIFKDLSYLIWYNYIKFVFLIISAIGRIIYYTYIIKSIWLINKFFEKIKVKGFHGKLLITFFGLLGFSEILNLMVFKRREYLYKLLNGEKEELSSSFQFFYYVSYKVWFILIILAMMLINLMLFYFADANFDNKKVLVMSNDQ